jgi:Tfp pilus assembly protein FimT
MIQTGINKSGLAIIEVLIALALMMLVFAVTNIGTTSSRDNLDKILDDVERGTRFATAESALVNAIVRVNFLLQNDPQEYSVEFSNDGSLILPAINNKTIVKSKKEEEEEIKQQNKLDKMFSKVKEFQKEGRKIENSDIRLVGIATNYSEKLITNRSISIYFYPSGERDGAIIFVASEDEIAEIIISPFLAEITRNYYPLVETEDEDDLFEAQTNKAEELYQKWVKL